ncbi:MAG: MFS transporter [Curvibacter sp.]|nr:MAG: MFS transporter [Curvibacter sp.]
MTSFDISAGPAHAPEGASRRRAWGIALLCFLTVTLDGYDTTAIGFVVPTLAQLWQLPGAAFTPAFMATSAGAVLGYMLSGRLSAGLGRRRAMLLTVAWFGLGSLATVAAQGVVSLSVLRLLTGVGLGAALPAAASLAVEQFAPRYREQVAVAVVAGLSVGAVLGGLVGGPLITHGGWGAVFGLGGVLPLALLPLLYWGLPQDDLQAPGPGGPTGAAGGDHRAQGRVAALFSAGQGGQTGLIWAFAFLVFSATYALQLWMPTLLGSFGFTPAQAPRAVAALGLGGLAGAALLMGLAGVLGVFLALPILLMLTLLALCSLSLLPLGPLGVLLMIACMGVGLIGGCLGQAAMAISLYAPAQRTSGVGWAAAWGRIGSIAGPALGGVMLAADRGPREIVLWAGVPVLAAMGVVLYLGISLSRRQHRA